jgi:hypothetical protein
MVVEIGGESTMLDLTDMMTDFHGLAKGQVSSLFQVIANRVTLPTNARLLVPAIIHQFVQEDMRLNATDGLLTIEESADLGHHFNDDGDELEVYD